MCKTILHHDKHTEWLTGTAPPKCRFTASRATAAPYSEASNHPSESVKTLQLTQKAADQTRTSTEITSLLDQLLNWLQ